jgi:hypothetical protein
MALLDDQEHCHIMLTVPSHHANSAVTSTMALSRDQQRCCVIDSAVTSCEQCQHINDSTVPGSTALLHHIDSAVASCQQCRHINDGTVMCSTALSHDQQRCHTNTSTKALSQDRRHCRIMLTVLSHHVNSADTSRMALSDDQERCHIASTVLTHQGQHCHRINSSVASH